MTRSKIQGESVNLADTFAFTGTVTGTDKGMKLLLDATISSAVSEYDISSTYISSTYDSYYLDVALHPATDNVVPYMRPIVSGSVVTSDIGYETYGIDEGKIVGDNAAYIRLSRSNVGNADGEGLTLSGHLQNVNDSFFPWCFSGLANSAKTDATHEGSIVTGGFQVGSRASVVNGIRLYFSSGNIESGTVKLYGIET